MLFYLKLGVRNLIKNYRRSVKTMLTIVIGLGACLLAQGFMSHTLWGLRESLINGGYGHFQIFKKGFLKNSDEKPYQYLISNPDLIVRELSNIPGIKLTAPRLSFQGIVSSGDKSTIVIGTAGFSREEQTLNTYSTLKAGSYLKDEKPFEVMIGSGIARKLNVGVSNSVTVMAALKGGGVNAVDLEVSGILGAQIKAYDDVLMVANLKAIQNLISIPNSVDRVIVLLNRTEDLEKVEPAIRKLCGQMGLEYRSWQQLAGVQYTQPKLFYDLVFVLMMMIIVLVVIFSITNTLNLAMNERVREIGTIRSLGTTRLQVGKIYITESLLIGVAGGFFGIIAGYGLSFLFNSLGGIPIPPPPGQARGYIAYFKPDLVQALWLWLLFILTAGLAGFYPAFRAARLQIVDALRWI